MIGVNLGVGNGSDTELYPRYRICRKAKKQGGAGKMASHYLLQFCAIQLMQVFGKLFPLPVKADAEKPWRE